MSLANKSVARPAALRTVRNRAAVVCHASRTDASLLQHLAGAAAATVAAGLVAFPALASSEGVSLNVTNGAKVGSPVHLEFSVQGMAVKPASEGLQAGTGHFHLLLDENVLPEEGEAIPFDATHLHYGKGQTAADVELTPGTHKLTLQFANALHQSYGAKFASTVTVNVQ